MKAIDILSDCQTTQHNFSPPVSTYPGYWLDIAETTQILRLSLDTEPAVFQLYCCSHLSSTIYIWDLRVYRPTLQSSAEKKKEEGIITVPPDVPTTFKHLDLAWKPLIKVQQRSTENFKEWLRWRENA